ncbi:unnamed protein product, partial [Rotaria sp. Silwood1]
MSTTNGNNDDNAYYVDYDALAETGRATLAGENPNVGNSSPVLGGVGGLVFTSAVNNIATRATGDTLISLSNG